MMDSNTLTQSFLQLSSHEANISTKRLSEIMDYERTEKRETVSGDINEKNI